MNKYLLFLICCVYACGDDSQSEALSAWSNGNSKEIRKYEPVAEGEPDRYLQQLFYENGQLQLQGAWIDSLRNGKWQEWYEDGTLMREGMYILGKKNGLHLSYYANGEVKERANYEGGELSGPYRLLDAKGNVLAEGEFEAGHQVGQWVEAADPEVGSPATWANYYEDGRLESKQEFISERDNHYTWQYLSPEGILLEKGTYFSGEKDEAWEYFYDSGNPKSAGRYEVGLKAGVWTYWYPNGKKQQELDIDRREELLINYWYANGEQAVEDGKGRIVDTIRDVRRVRVIRDGVEKRSREKDL